MKVIGYLLVGMICVQGLLSAGLVMENTIMRSFISDKAQARLLKDAAKDCSKTSSSSKDSG